MITKAVRNNFKSNFFPIWKKFLCKTFYSFVLLIFKLSFLNFLNVPKTLQNNLQLMAIW